MKLTQLSEELVLNVVRYLPTFHVLHACQDYVPILNHICEYTLPGVHRYLKVYDTDMAEDMLRLFLTSGYPYQAMVEYTLPGLLQELQLSDDVIKDMLHNAQNSK